MSTCAVCGGALEPEWNFCIHCGTPTLPPRPARARWNRIAILAIVLAVVGGPFALVFGHLALTQITRTGERGRVLAVVATVLGYLWLAAGIVLVFWYVGNRG